MDISASRDQPRQVDEAEFHLRYAAVVAQKRADYCLIAVTLKSFSEYLHVIGQEKYAAVKKVFYDQLLPLMNQDACIVHLGYGYFCMLLECAHTLEALHARAAEMHFAVRDGMEKAFGRKLYLALGFYPLRASYVSFHDAVCFANLCRKGPQYRFPETNYDMYGVSYIDHQEAFRKLESSVEKAMERGDFKLYLQPKVNVKTGEITSAEALVRWQDPERGLIPLGDFLPQMEENGYIRDLDQYLFRIACQYMDRWLHTHGKKITLSFNLNRAYFSEPFFMQDYSQVFEQYDLSPDCVCIEILESIVLDDMDRLRQLIAEIHDYGFACALDDFGSGFSTFSVLTSVKLDELKIDRSLFQNVNNPNERTVIKHIIDIAHDLGMCSVAEGIETAEYANYLREIGCDFIQGFYHFRPMPVEEFEQRFVTGTWDMVE